MAPLQSKPHNFSIGRVVAFPIRSATQVPTEFEAQSGGLQAIDRQVGIRTYSIRGVVVLEIAGRLSDADEVLDRAIQLALAEGPRGVVCDLSGALDGAAPWAVEMLATAGRHVRNWSGIPVAVACSDQRVRQALAAHPMGGRLIVTESMFSAVSLVLVTPTVPVERLRLAPHPTAPRAARDFVTRTLLDWGFNPLILSANFVVSELVANSMMGATNDMELSVAWNQRALRLTVRDNTPDLLGQPYTKFDRHGRRLSAVASLTRAFGVLPTADGGKVVWAVLNATRLASIDEPTPS
jgi:hypothetical protein